MTDFDHGIPIGGFDVRSSAGSKGRLCEVVEIVVHEGSGEPDDVIRPVVYYFTRDGRALARQDDWEQEEYRKSRKWGKNYEGRGE